MGYLLNRYKKYISRGAALATAGLFFTPLSAFASASTITDTNGNSVIGSGSVHEIFAQNITDGVAVSRYKDFNLSQNEIANMYFRTSAGGADGSHLVNLVQNHIDINGTVNALKNNSIGGDIFFLSPNGIAVGASGAINAGSVNLIVPSEEPTDLSMAGLRGITSFNDAKKLEISGQLNARNGIYLGATNIDVRTGAELTSNKDINFSTLVNVSGDASIPASLSGVTMTATNAPGGDIILVAHSEHVATDDNLGQIINDEAVTGWAPNKKTDIAANINVDGKITGDRSVSLDATAKTSFTEGAVVNILSQTGILDDILGAVGLDVAADWVDKTSKANISVGANGAIESGHALKMNAQSDLKIQLSTITPAVKSGNLAGSFLPTTALDVVLFKNDASIDVSGSLKSGQNLPDNFSSLSAMDAKAYMTQLTATATSTSITNARAATRTKPVGGVDPDLVYAAVLVEKGDTNASIHLNNTVDTEADFAAAATTVSAIDGKAAAVAPNGSVAAAAVGYLDYDSNASVDIDKNVNARSVTVNANNRIARDALSATSTIGESDPEVKNPFIIKNADGKTPGTGMVDAFLPGLINKAAQFVKIDVASGKMSSWRTAGVDKNDTANTLAQNFLNGNYFKAGASIAATDQHNTSSVRVGKDAVISTTLPVNLSAKTHVDSDEDFERSDFLNFTAVGELNSQKKSQNAKVMVAGAVVVDSVQNDAVVTFESDGTNAARVNSTNGAIGVDANANVYYNQAESAVKFACDKLKTFATAVKDAGLDYEDTLDAIAKDIDTLRETEVIDSVEKINKIWDDFVAVGEAILDDIDSTTEAYRQAKIAYNAVLTVLDPATFTNYYARTQARSNATGSSEFDITGAVNVDILKNRATILADQGTSFSAKGDVSLNAHTETNTVTISGNGGKYGTTNQSAGSGLGATVAVQDVDASSLLMLGKGVNVNSTGGNVNLTADNMMIQTDIVYGAGESKGAAALNGMIGVITGASNSVVSVDDEANLTAAKNAQITADNDTTITAIAGGATLGGNQTYAAVGASLMNVAYDVNNYALVSDNGTDVAIVPVSLTDAEKKEIENAVDADIAAGKLDQDSRNAEIAAKEDEKLAEKQTTEGSAAQTISDGVQLAHNMADRARVGSADAESEVSNAAPGYENIGVKTASGAARGKITAADFSAAANTDGVINSIAIEGTAISDSHPAIDSFNKYVGKAETFVSYLPQAANWPMDKVSKMIGGKIAGKLNGKSAGQALDKGANEANPNKAGNANLATQQEAQAMIRIGGAGSVAVNLGDGATAAVVDGVDLNAKNVSLTADDFLFKGAWAGAAAVNWDKGKGDVPTFEGSVGGALALNSSSRDVDAILRNAKIENAESITNSAQKSGADVAVALGVALTKSVVPEASAGVSASLSYNMADSDVHALMINDTVTGSNAKLENMAADADVQVAGGMSASVTTGNTDASIGGGGSATANRVRNDVQSGVIGGTYSGITDFGVDAVKSVNQVGVAVAADYTSSDTGLAVGFTGAVSYNDTDNTTRAFLDGATVTADALAVEANDTPGLNQYDDYLSARGVDPTGTSFLGANAEDPKNPESGESFLPDGLKNPKGGVVIGGALAGEYTGGQNGESGGAGIAITYNASKNDMIAEVNNSKVTASSLHALTTDQTTIASLGLGASMDGSIFGGAGAVSWNDIQNTNTVDFGNNTITADSVKGITKNESRIVNVTGEGSGGSGVAAGFNFSFNDLDNASNATLAGGTYTAKDASKGLAMDLETQNHEFDFALGLGASVSTKTGALAGTAAVTTGDSSAETKIGDGSGTKTTITNAKSINVSADDSATKVTLGGEAVVSTGKVGAVGVSIAYADIGGNSMDTTKADEKLRAEINDAEITTVSGATIDVKTKDQGSLFTAAVGAGVSTGKNPVNIQGAAAVSELAKDAGASIADSNIDASAGGKNSVVTVASNSTNKIWTSGIAAPIAPSGAYVSAGAALSISQINHNTNVAFDSTTANLKSLLLSGVGYSDIFADAAGVSVAGSGLALAGSFAYDYIGSNVSAAMSKAAVTADGSIGVVAQSDEEISNYAGSIAGGDYAGVGVSVNINKLTGDTTATVTGSTLTAKGNDNGVTVNSDVKDSDIIDIQDPNGGIIDPTLSDKRTSSPKKGVVVDASATHAIVSDLVSGGFAADAGLEGTFNENFISGTTSALLKETNVNSGVSPVASTQDVNVRAADFMNLGTLVLSASGSGYASLGVSENTNLLERETSAQVIGKSDTERAAINAHDFKTEAVSKKGAGHIAAAGAISGEGASAMANVIYDSLSGNTFADVKNADVAFTNAAKVSADNLHKASMVYFQGAFTGVGAGLALSAGVIEQSSETTVSVEDSSISGGSDKAELTAHNKTETRSMAGNVGFAGEGFGGAGTVFVNQFDNVVGVTANNATIEAGSVKLAADNDLKTESYGGSVAIAGLGASLGISTLYNSVSDKVFVDVTDKTKTTNGNSMYYPSTLNAKSGDLTISAATNRDFTQGVASISGSAFAGVAVNYLGEYINWAVDNDDLKTKINALNDPTQTKTLNATDFEGLTADEKTQVNNDKAFYVWDAPQSREGIEDGLHVRVAGSTAKAAKRLDINATEQNDLMANGDAGGLGIAGVTASAVDVRAKRDNSVILDDATVSGTTVDIRAAAQNVKNDDGSDGDGMHTVSFTGSAGGVALAALESVASTSGNTVVNVKDSSITSSNNNLSIAAEDTARIKAESVCMTFGIGTVSGLYTKAENTGATGVSFSGNNTVDAGTSGALSVSASKRNAVDAQSISGAYTAGFGVTINNTLANDTGSSFVAIEGSGNTFKAKDASFSATNAPTLSVDIDQDGAGLIPGLVSYGEIALSSGAAVTAEKDNTFYADNLTFSSKVGDESKTTADVSVASVAAAAGGDLNVTGDHAYADSTAKAATDVASQKYFGANGGEKGTALTVSAENNINKKLDIWNVNVGLIELPCASILGKSTSTDLVQATAAGGNVKSLAISATASANVTNDVMGAGGAIVEASLGGNVAKAETNFDDNAKANLSGTWNLGGGEARIAAIQNDMVNYGAIAGTLAALDITGAQSNLTINGGASTDIAGGSSVAGASEFHASASNRASVNQDGQHDRNVSGMIDALGGIDAVSSEVNATRSSAVTVGENVSINTAGQQTYDAYTDADVSNVAYGMASGGFVGGAAEAKTNLSSTNSVSVGKGATLTNLENGLSGAITLAAHDDLNMITNAEANTGGLASVMADANAKHTVTRKNTVDLAGAVKGVDNVNLHAGANVEGKLSESNHNIIAEAYNESACPSISPDVTNTMIETGRVNVTADSTVLANRDINLIAQGGNENIKTQTKAWSWFGGDRMHTDLLGSVNGVKDYGQTADNAVNVDGTMAAGQNNDVFIKISGEMVPNTSDYPANIEGRNDAGQYTISVMNAENGGTELSNIRNSIRTGTFDYGNALVTKWYELTDCINAYQGKALSGEDLEAYSGFVAERAALEAEMDQLGLLSTETKDGKTVTMPISGKDGQAGYDVVYVELPDGISATGGNINVKSDDLTGKGSLKAVGSTQVNIENTSNAYLKVGSISIGDEGGNISLNGALLSTSGSIDNKNQQVNGLNLSGKGAAFKELGTETTKSSEIVISNNCSNKSVTMVKPDDPNQKDIYKAVSTMEIKGVIDAQSGDATISNQSGSIVIDENAGVNGAAVSITAAGSLSVGYTPGTYNIDGAPEEDYASIKKDEGLNKKLNINTADHQQNYQNADWLKARDTRNAGTGHVVGGNITIAATTINVNGLIQSGYDKYVVDISEDKVKDLKDQLASGGAVSYATKTIDGRTMYRLYDAENFHEDGEAHFSYRAAVYYDPKEDKLFVEDIAAQGGNITLVGRIVNTSLNGEGRIVAANGGADFDFRNASDVPLVIKEIENKKRTALITIYDSLDPHYDPQKPSTFVAGSNTYKQYEPVKGAIYSWTDGTTSEVTKHYESDTTELFGFIETDFKEYETDSNCTQTDTVQGRDLPDGSYAAIDEDFKNNGNDPNNSAYRITADNVITGETRSDVSTTTDWHFLNKHYYNTWTVTTGSKQTYVHSLRADNPITVDFLEGSGWANINIDSKGGVIFSGNVTGADSVSPLTVNSSSGSITQNTSTFIRGNDFQFTAKGDISGLKLQAFPEKSWIDLSAVSEEGNVAIKTGGADLKITHIAAGVGKDLTADSYGAKSVTLSSEGSILMPDYAPSNDTITPYGVKGSYIDLEAKGAVGSADKALIVQGGQTPVGDDPQSASVNISAQRNINVSQQAGDLRVGRIESANGSVTLTAADGRILDALPDPEITFAASDVSEKTKRWADAGIIADSEVSADYVGTRTRIAQQSVADYESQAREAWDQYTARKSYYSVAANQNENDPNYQVYKRLDEKFNGYASVDDFLAAQAKDSSSRYSQIQNVSAAPWTKDMMLYALRDSIVNKTTGSTDNSGKLANVVGNDITLRSAKGIGEVGAEQETIQIDWLKPGYKDANGRTNVDYLKDLTNANDADITVNRDSDGIITSFDIQKSSPLGVYGRKNSLGAKGALLYADSVTTKDDAAVGDYGIFIAARDKSDVEVATPLTIDQIVTSGNADVRLLGKNGILATDKSDKTDAAQQFDIIGRNLIIEGGRGVIGGKADTNGSASLHLALSGMLTARAEDDISIKNYFDAKENSFSYAGCDALQLGAVYSPNKIFLGGYNSIVMSPDADPVAYVNAGEHVTFFTPGVNGSVGTETEGVRVLANGTPVGLYADQFKYVHLSGVRGMQNNPTLVIHGKPNADYPENNGVIAAQKLVVESEGDLLLGRADLAGKIVAIPSVTNADTTTPTVVLSAKRDLMLNGDIYSYYDLLDENGWHCYGCTIDLTAGRNIMQNAGGLYVGTVTTHTGGGVTLMSDTNGFHTYNAYGLNGVIDGDLKVATHPLGTFIRWTNGTNLFNVNLQARSAQNFDFTNLDNGDISYSMLMPFGKLMTWRHGSKFTAKHRNLMNRYYRAESAIIDGMNFRFPMDFGFGFFDIGNRGELIAFYLDDVKNASADEFIIDEDEDDDDEKEA